eukprot:928151-Alexandrium_andersonii.AAC.1
MPQAGVPSGVARMQAGPRRHLPAGDPLHRQGSRRGGLLLGPRWGPIHGAGRLRRGRGRHQERRAGPRGDESLPA